MTLPREYLKIKIPGLTDFLPNTYSLYMNVTDLSIRRMLRSGRSNNYNKRYNIMIRSNINPREPKLAFAIFDLKSDYIHPDTENDPNYKDSDLEIYLDYLGSHISGIGLGHFLIFCVVTIAQYHISREQINRRLIMGLSDETGTIGNEDNIYVKLGCKQTGEASDLYCDVKTILTKFDKFKDKYVNKGFFGDKILLSVQKKIDYLKFLSPKYYPGFKSMKMREDLPEDLSPAEVSELLKKNYELTIENN